MTGLLSGLLHRLLVNFGATINALEADVAGLAADVAAIINAPVTLGPLV